MSIFSIHYPPRYSSYSFIENSLNFLNLQNNRIGWIAAAALSCLVLGYLLYFCCIECRQIAILDQDPLTDDSEIISDHEEEILNLHDPLLTQVHSSQATKNLYHLAECACALKEINGLPLQVKMLPSTHPTLGGMKGYCSWDTGEICISSGLTPERTFSALIFELANMTQALKFKKVHDACLNRELSREEYAFEMEQIEYLSVLLHTTTIKDAIIEKGATWSKYDRYHLAALDEIAHLNRQIEGNHTQYYLKAWDDSYGKLLSKG